MILADTSVVVPWLWTGDPKLDGLFRSLPVAVCGVARAELLHGVRSARDRVRTVAALAGFLPVSIPDALWDQTGDNLNLLQRGGVTIPFADGVIATVAIANDIELWTRDAHFTHV